MALIHDFTVYHFQALLGVHPTRPPQWSDVMARALPGWEKWRDHPHRMGGKALPGHRFRRFWSDGLTFTDKQTALLALAHLQPLSGHKLRVVERHERLEEEPLEPPKPKEPPAPKAHVQFKCPPGHHEEQENFGYCKFCDGGLSLCTVCHGAEASMPTECPGRPLLPEEQDQIQAGTLDFRNGKWWTAD